jgi:DNA-binding response OmpR family regulator
MERGHYLTFGPFRLDTMHGHVWQGERVTTLRPRSLAMLRYLVVHPGRLATKAEA